MKKISVFCLLLVFCSLLALPVSAATNTIHIAPALSFSDSTADCSAIVSYTGKEIDATMELWCGTTLVAVWFSSGTNYVSISGSASIITGRTYTLKVYGTANGISFEAVPVSRSC